MKKALLFLFVLMLSAAALFAQAPQKMSYQAVVRNANNTLVTSQNVSARVSILQGSVNGTPVYVEIHNATTNANGLLTLEVGGGSTVVGSLAAVDWANGPFFLKSEIDPNGGVNYSIEGTQQLMSVPYALYAEKAGNVPAFGITPVDSGYVIAVTQPGGTPQTYFLPTGGGQGPAGNDGLSAYQLWLNAGNTGSEADFLASLVGTPGNDGQDGVGIDSIAKTGTADNVDTYTIYYSNNTTSTYTVTNGVDGAPGTPGDPGTPGAPGDPGFSPTITVDTGAAGMVLTITDVNGTNQYIIPNGGGSGSGGTIVQQQVNWNETNPASVSYILNKPSLATVATSGSYNDLLDKPAIPTNISQLNNDAGFVTTASVPTLNVTQTDTGYVLTITENGSTQTYILRDGRDGQDGQDGNDGNDGEDGNDGVSPTITLDTAGSNLMVTITDANGSNTTIIPLSSGSGTFTQLPADWNATSGVQQILHKPTLATVATSGNYNDLTNKPTIPAEQVQANWNETNTSSKAYIQNKPTIPAAQVNADWDATSGVQQILHKPTLATVATSGSYNDLSNKPTIPAEQVQANWNETNTSSKAYIQNKPTIPAAQVNADWNATSGVAQIMNKPVLADVATSGDYDDLDNKPTLATVATSGSYNDLTNKPTIPDAQVNADWNATSGMAEILNKPDFAGMENALDSLQNAMSDMQDNLDNEMGFICGISKVKDYDGNEYNTVKIGNQCWLKENLRSTHYSDGTEIPYSSTLSTSVGYRCYPNNDSANVAKFGYLYNWTAFMNGADAVGGNPSGVQGICPKGWHVPSWTEFDILWIYVRDEHPEWRCNSNAENISKALAATTDWQTSTYECAIGNDLTQNNASGFSALPAGMHSSSYTKFSLSTYFWTTSYYSLDSTRRRTLYLGNNDRKLFSQYSGLDVGHSVRCLKDETVGAIENEINRLQNYIDSVTNTFTCGISKVKDYDGNEYHTVKIGDQCWMKENMRAQHYSDGTAIQTGTDTSSTTPYYYYHSESYRYSLEDLGLYYNWAAATNSSASSTNPSSVQGVCPTGWHVPSMAEWNQLFAYARSQSSWRCDATSTNIAKALASDQYWGNSSTSCVPGNDFTQNNVSGFSAIAGGSVSYYGTPTPTIHFGGNYGYQFTAWASEIATTVDKAKYVYINYQYPGAYTSSSGYQIYCGLSVRCLRDPESSAGGITPESIQNMINNSLAPLQHTIDSLQNVINQQQQQLSENGVCGFAKVTDYDGNEYNTIKIGNQCWMKENLRSIHYSDGTEIPLGTDSSNTTSYRYYPDNDSSTVSSLGFLYNWFAVVRGGSVGTTSVVQGICPTGWHVPSQDEFTQLKEFVKSKEEYRCNDNQWSIGKALADSVLWLSYSLECVVGNNLSANNATGFSARPTGYYRTNFQSYTGVWHYGSRNFSTAYWASNTSTVNSNNAYYLSISSSTNNMGGSPTTDSKWSANSVRCLKD